MKGAIRQCAAIVQFFCPRSSAVRRIFRRHPAHPLFDVCRLCLHRRRAVGDLLLRHRICFRQRVADHPRLGGAAFRVCRRGGRGACGIHDFQMEQIRQGGEGNQVIRVWSEPDAAVPDGDSICQSAI